MANQYGSPKRYNGLNDKLLKEVVQLAHTVMAQAWNGDFDEVWEKCPDIDGKPQREIFFENVSQYLPEMEKEALRRKLHL